MPGFFKPARYFRFLSVMPVTGCSYFLIDLTFALQAFVNRYSDSYVALLKTGLAEIHLRFTVHWSVPPFLF